MATIDRDIEGNRWQVNERSEVSCNGMHIGNQHAIAPGRPVITRQQVTTYMTLVDEWLALVEREKAEREPETRLPEWAKFAKQGLPSNSRTGWVIDCQEPEKSVIVYRVGTVGYTMQKLAIAAADELDIRADPLGVARATPDPAKAGLPDGYYFEEITNGFTLRHANGNIQPYIDCGERLRAFEALCAAYRAQQKKG